MLASRSIFARSIMIFRWKGIGLWQVLRHPGRLIFVAVRARMMIISVCLPWRWIVAGLALHPFILGRAFQGDL